MKKLIYILFILFSLQVWPQQELITIGNQQDRPGINWFDVNSENFQIIYPEGLGQFAERSLRMAEHLDPILNEGLGEEKKKISIIFRPYSSQSNGFVTLAPRRSEWYTMPWPSNAMGTTNWLDTLAVHEMRHVRQFDNLNHGFNKGLYFIMGEQGLALGIGWTVPPWQLEGDAVVTETKWGPSGRGRIPLFSQHFRTLLSRPLDEYNYDRLSLGSFREFIPNHYVYGYHQTSYLTEKYPDIWREVYLLTADKSYNPFSFYNALFDRTFKTPDELTADMINYWREKHGVKPSDDKAEKWVSSENYRYCNEESMIFTKKSLDRPTKLVFRDLVKGEERELLTMGTFQGITPDCKNDKIVWSEIVPDKRWGKQSYSIVFVHDLSTNKTTQIGHHKRWFSPTMFSNGNSFAVVEVDEKSHYSLLEIDLQGNILRKLIDDPASYILTPYLSRDGNFLSFIRQDKQFGKKSIRLLNLQDNKVDEIISPTFTDIANPIVESNQVYFQGAREHKESIYCFDLQSRKLKVLNEAMYGQAFPATGKGPTLLVADYSINGYRMTQIDKNTSNWSEITALKDPHAENDMITDFNSKNVGESGLLKDSIFKEESYSLTRNSVNPHSWRLVALPWWAYYYLEVYSTDILSRLEIVGGFQRSQNDGSHALYAGVTWAGWYPLISLRGVREKRVALYSGSQAQYWLENDLQLSFTLPFNFSKRSVSNISSLSYVRHFKQETYDWTSGFHYSDGQLQTDELQAKWSWGTAKSYRDLFAPVGQEWYLGWQQGSGQGKWHGLSSQRSASLTQFLPGVSTNQHLLLRGSYESRPQSNTYLYSSNIPFSRGYSQTNYPLIKMLSMNYYIPLIYPDWSLGRFLYIKRIFLNPFYDYAYVKTAQNDQYYRSYGAELFWDTHLLRNMYLELKWGIRASYLVDQNKMEYSPFFMALTGSY